MERSAGILLPISALPSPYGIGTLGKAAYDFIDFLEKTEQKWWQILPVGPTSKGDSPYQSFSAFAGNPYFIDLEFLCEEGLSQKEDIEKIVWSESLDCVDYEKLYRHRFPLLKKAKESGWEKDKDAIDRFIEENEKWLNDYALFMALKRYFGMKAWTEWEDKGARLRNAETLAYYRKNLKEDIELFQYIQYLFFRQWNRLRKYAEEKGIGIIGDIPIYVSLDSADVWAEPQWFQLDENLLPEKVSGVPPDNFSAEGQLWGNPLYDWEMLKADGYGWWIRRIDGAMNLYDVIRIDHFRGLESYWAIPYSDARAGNGYWEKGPGMDLISVLKNWFTQDKFIAEDLGYLTPEVNLFLQDSGFPGMKVLEFAFYGEDNEYLPHHYPANCVCYIGTHDNESVMGWKETASSDEITLAEKYFGINEAEGFHWGMIRGGMASVADLFIAQMQDYLALGTASRMNTPGTLGGNWQWRLVEGQLTEALTERIADLTRRYGRSSEKWQV